MFAAPNIPPVAPAPFLVRVSRSKGTSSILIIAHAHGVRPSPTSGTAVIIGNDCFFWPSSNDQPFVFGSRLPRQRVLEASACAGRASPRHVDGFVAAVVREGVVGGVLVLVLRFFRRPREGGGALGDVCHFFLPCACAVQGWL